VLSDEAEVICFSWKWKNSVVSTLASFDCVEKEPQRYLCLSLACGLELFDSSSLDVTIQPRSKTSDSWLDCVSGTAFVI
jgi:hypothetical protein